MELLTRARPIGLALLRLFFPPRCVGCRRFGDLICPVCQTQITFLGAEAAISYGDYPGACSIRRRFRFLDGVRSAAVFDGPIREAVHHLKYGGRRELAPLLGGWMADCWKQTALTASAVVPVPLHLHRERERGYNQSLLLASTVSALTGTPLHARALQRVRDTPPQIGLTGPQRAENVRGAFACTSPMQGASVLIVDDVTTTGATLDACAAALKESGCSRVWGLTAARPMNLAQV